MFGIKKLKDDEFELRTRCKHLEQKYHYLSSELDYLTFVVNNPFRYNIDEVVYAFEKGKFNSYIIVSRQHYRFSADKRNEAILYNQKYYDKHTVVYSLRRISDHQICNVLDTYEFSEKEIYTKEQFDKICCSINNKQNESKGESTK